MSLAVDRLLRLSKLTHWLEACVLALCVAGCGAEPGGDAGFTDIPRASPEDVGIVR